MLRRPRRLRATQALRNLVRETKLEKEDLIYPLFIVDGENIKREISSMEGVYHFSVDMLEDEIKELVNGIDYKKANYTRVDHYLNSIPKDLSIYKEDSVKNLQFVIDMIQRELPKSMQDTVYQ